MKPINPELKEMLDAAPQGIGYRNRLAAAIARARASGAARMGFINPVWDLISDSEDLLNDQRPRFPQYQTAEGLEKLIADLEKYA